MFGGVNKVNNPVWRARLWTQHTAVYGLSASAAFPLRCKSQRPEGAEAELDRRRLGDVWPLGSAEGPNYIFIKWCKMLVLSN